MKITLLGTGSPIPHPARAGSATLVTADGLTLLVDCGRGVLLRLTAAGLFPPALDAGLVREIIDPVPVTKVAGARPSFPA